MIRRQFKEQSCHFRNFCSQDYHLLAAERNATPRPPKITKISLKTSHKNCSRLLSPSPIYHHRHTPSQNCPTVAESTRTLKPNIKFSWKNEMIQTTKRGADATGQQGRGEVGLQETKIADFKGKLMIESRYTAEQQLSLPPLTLAHHIPQTTFQESLILVDYFHPSSHQMSRIETYLHDKDE